MDRRRRQRRARRVQVQFWRRGDPHPTSGYTTNISPTGMFIGSSAPLPLGTRVRVEVLDPENGFMVEGLVVHSVRVPPQYQQVRLTGMGIRFLKVDELVGSLFGGPGVFQVEEEGPPTDGVYPVRFRTMNQFLDALRRDIKTGGIFVPTRFPAELNQRVTVEIQLPDGRTEPVRVAAMVVQRVEHDATDTAKTAGMGVAFADPQGALVQLQPIIERYGG
jgi:Tfp pilus assembly protein PilZ